jgi:hypothetical protein
MASTERAETGEEPSAILSARQRELRNGDCYAPVLSKMKSAASARLGNDRTPGCGQSPGPTHKPEAPMATASPISSGRSPTIHDEPKSKLSSWAAAIAIPGRGLRSSL